MDKFLAKTFYGLENVLAKELIELGANDVETGNRAVSFSGDKAIMYKANFCCRTAIRILKVVKTFNARSADDIYNEVKKIDWSKHLDPKKTFSIDSVVYSEDFRHSKFVTYRVKDAIADQFTEKFGKRPSVSVENPDLSINIHISHNTCTLSFDSSGESLHKRGYRASQNDAPISEVLAAGMILMTGWHGECDFVDPMCGSGTILIEAAMIALNIAPGIYRKEFAFEKWDDFDEDLFREIYDDQSQEREFKHKIYGSDISPRAVKIAETNIKNAGLKKYIELQTKPIQELDAPAPQGIIVTNPPYGERLNTDDLNTLYAAIGERLKHHFTGYNAWLISSSKEALGKIGLKPSKKIKLLNSELECSYQKYEIFDGKRKDFVGKKGGKNGKTQV
ncbi:MAG: RNA methyltransferase [Paludibacteraceae bacterium]|nr:RNA methyltransferase [Paludibacteraceae bacterium]